MVVNSNAAKENKTKKISIKRFKNLHIASYANYGVEKSNGENRIKIFKGR